MTATEVMIQQQEHENMVREQHHTILQHHQNALKAGCVRYYITEKMLKSWVMPLTSDSKDTITAQQVPAKEDPLRFGL
jgi:hypothetical protein